MGYDEGHWTHCKKCDSLLFDGKPSCEEHEAMRRTIAELEAQVKQAEANRSAWVAAEQSAADYAKKWNDAEARAEKSESELADYKAQAEMVIEDQRRGYSALYKEAQAAHVRVDAALERARKAERDAARAKNTWTPMETAPKGNGDKINDTRDPRWVDSPHILLLFPGGEVSVAYWDWFYAPGGRGYIGTIPWVEPVSGELVGLSYGAPVAWMEISSAVRLGG